MVSLTWIFIVSVATLVLAATADGNPCEGLEGVQNLRRVENVVTWEPPQVSELCVVFYSIVHEDNLGTKQIITSDSRYEFELISCATNTISVTAKSTDLTSEITTTVTFQNPVSAQLPRPVGVGIIPGSTTATVYWQAAPVSVGACETTSFLTVVRSGDGPSLQNVWVDVSDSTNSAIRVDLTDLEPGRGYQLYGVSFAGNVQSEMSEPFQFTTKFY